MSNKRSIIDEFITHLQSPTVTIPDIQEEMGIDYKTAFNLFEFAIKCEWLKPCKKGIVYETNPATFKPKKLTDSQCQQIYNDLERSGLRVLYYFLKNEAPTFQDFLHDVSNDVSDMREGIDQLLDTHIIVEYDGVYYCNISESSIQEIKKCN